MQQRFVRDPVIAAPRRSKAFDELHHLATVFEPMHTAFDTCHRMRPSLKQIRDRRCEALQVAAKDRLIFAKLTLTLARTLAHDMTAAAELVAVLNDAVRADLHSFCGTAVGTDLRH
jgi:hypothetical protein